VAEGAGGRGCIFPFSKSGPHRPKNAGKRHDCGRRRKIRMGGGGQVFVLRQGRMSTFIGL
jgi:hypothetical protein